MANCGECLWRDQEVVELLPSGTCPRCGADYGKTSATSARRRSSAIKSPAPSATASHSAPAAAGPPAHLTARISEERIAALFDQFCRVSMPHATADQREAARLPFCAGAALILIEFAGLLDGEDREALAEHVATMLRRTVH